MPSCVARELTVAVADTDCMDLEGNGSAGDPVTATPIIPATVTHPILPGPITLDNGITCEADGFQVQPWGQPNVNIAQQLSGTIPTIAADTPPGPGPNGSILWGPRLDLMAINIDPTRPAAKVTGRTYPTLHAILEPGARLEVYGELYSAPLNAPAAALAPFLLEVVWTFTNTGGVTARWDIGQMGHQLQLSGAFPPNGGGTDFVWSAVQMYVLASGFTGGSSASSGLLGSGVYLTSMQVPV